MRFNKANPNLLLISGSALVKTRRHKLFRYLIKTNQQRAAFDKTWGLIRAKNIFTQRGLYQRNHIDYRKIGFVSGYV